MNTCFLKAELENPYRMNVTGSAGYLQTKLLTNNRTSKITLQTEKLLLENHIVNKKYSIHSR